jgi:uncharacterized cofD-like protein
MPGRTNTAALAPSPLVNDPVRIVSIGGGTGLSTVLSGLKEYARGVHGELPALGPPEVDITAVVTVSDDGGSSGRLRREFDILPPGDIRNCMVALSEDAALLSKLFQYRFHSGAGLKGHSFGNLFLAALNQITGDFSSAVRLSSEILAIRGNIFPATASNVTLEARFQGGRVVSGESKISKSRQLIERVSLRPARCRAFHEVLAARAHADLITLGPGSLYTSVIPNLLVKGIPEAIERSPALTLYFVNLMWQPGETLNFTASQHVEAIFKHARGRKVMDCVVLNTAPISGALKRKYAKHHVEPVDNDFERLNALGVKIVAADLVGDSGLVRHEPRATAKIIMALAMRSRNDRLQRDRLQRDRLRKPKVKGAGRRTG